MDLNIEIIKKMDLDDIYQLLLPDLESIFSNYSFVNILEDDYKKIVKQLIFNSKEREYDSKYLYLDYIKNELKKYLNNIVKEKIKNKKELFEILNRYINMNLKEIDNGYEASYLLEKFTNFLVSINVSLSQEMLIKLIHENKIFHNLLQVLVSNLNNDINIEGLDSWIQTYCMLNNMELSLEDDVNFSKNRCEFSGVDIYLKEIRKFPVLTAEEEKDLAVRALNGENLARQKLFECNLKWVVKIANTFKGKSFSLSLMDLIQEGNLGLIKAIEKFDPTLGYRFTTYATYWIRQYISRAIKRQGKIVKIPLFKYEQINNYRKAQDALEKKLKREASVSEVADYMGISVDEVLELNVLQLESTSLNIYAGEDLDTEIMNFISSDEDFVHDVIEENEKQTAFKNALLNSGLTKRELDILSQRFSSEPRSLESIASKYNLTRERVRQIQNKALKNLKESPEFKKLAIELGYLKGFKISNNQIVKTENLKAKIEFLPSGAIKESAFVRSFLAKSKRILNITINNQPRIIKLLIDSNLTKKDIDYFILHYGLGMKYEEILLRYKVKFKNASKLFENSLNKKIELSFYYPEIKNYIISREKILSEFDYVIDNDVLKEIASSGYDNISKEIALSGDNNVLNEPVDWLLIQKEMINTIIDLIFKDYDKDVYNYSNLLDVLLHLPINELVVVYLLCKDNSAEIIAKTLNMNLEYVFKIREKMLILYRNCFDNSFSVSENLKPKILSI